MIAIKTVLVATDFSPPSDTAVRYALNLARTFGAKIHLLHVVDQVALYAAALGCTTPDFAPFQGQLEDDARQRLEASDGDCAQLQVECTVLTASPTARTILEFSRDINADLIILGTHGRTGFAHLVLGSVAEHVVRLAGCPVLTVHHPEHEFIAPDPIERAVTSAVQ